MNPKIELFTNLILWIVITNLLKNVIFQNVITKLLNVSTVSIMKTDLLNNLQ